MFSRNVAPVSLESWLMHFPLQGLIGHAPGSPQCRQKQECQHQSGSEPRGMHSPEQQVWKIREFCCQRKTLRARAVAYRRDGVNLQEKKNNKRPKGAHVLLLLFTAPAALAGVCAKCW